MPQRDLPNDLAQQALDAFTKYGTIKAASEALKLNRHTFDNRYSVALLRGLRPSTTRDLPTGRYRVKLGPSHLVIPDVQAKPEVSDAHLEWIANYAIEHRPTVVIQIGDWADMASLCMADKGKLCYEGRRYVRDIDAAISSRERFDRTIEDYNRTHTDDPFNPRKVLTYGNHEYRIIREGDTNPALSGKLQLTDLGFEDAGWETHPFLEIVKIDGVSYSHYFTSGVRGFPVSSAAALLRERQGSATMGHVQTYDVAIHKKTLFRGVFCGTCYTHNEPYLGLQGNGQRRQILMKHELDGEGRYDLMEVSLNFLKKKYS